MTFTFFVTLLTVFGNFFLDFVAVFFVADLAVVEPRVEEFFLEEVEEVFLEEVVVMLQIEW